MPIDTCNDKCFVQMLAATGESEKLARQVLDFHSKFIAERIKEGAYESVRISGFGIIRAKLKTIQSQAWFWAQAKFSRRVRGGAVQYPIGLPPDFYGVEDNADINID